jgi:hypothetical protein
VTFFSPSSLNLGSLKNSISDKMTVVVNFFKKLFGLVKKKLDNDNDPDQDPFNYPLF